MSLQFIRQAALEGFSQTAFRSTHPFPWHDFYEFLTPAGFQALLHDFPALALFERHEGLARGYGQRPHNRHYLAYRESVYHPTGYRGPGVVEANQLPASWRRFIEDLEGPAYTEFVRAALGVSRFTARYAWHVGTTGSEVSPHLDDVRTKSGLHIFYFNISQDWDHAWGGRLLVLGNRRRVVQNPEFDDFETRRAVEFLDNHSFFFKTTPEAWHGVEALTCPPETQRRLFTVIFEIPISPVSRVVGRLKRLIRRNAYPGQRITA